MGRQLATSLQVNFHTCVHNDSLVVEWLIWARVHVLRAILGVTGDQLILNIYIEKLIASIVLLFPLIEIGGIVIRLVAN